jgi:DNA segregation ATPase FtsK/SpoIIIE-like protein
LVGGTTGSGKSEWLRSAVASLLVTNGPDTLRLVLVDPKKNAFSELAGSPFLWRTDSLLDAPDGFVLAMIEDMVEEMTRRYGLFKHAGADDLVRYRRKTGEALPRVVCVVDEFADLLLAGGKRQRDDLERGFLRIAQTGRAAGVHLILATQRPSRQVVSGVLKASLPGKIAFKVANRIDSSVLLDGGGAQNLLGKGDLLLSSGAGLVRLQSPWLSEEERPALFRQAIVTTRPL